MVTRHNRPKTGARAALVKTFVPPSLKAKLVRKAKAEKMSLAALIERALDAYVATPAGFDLPEGDPQLAEIEARYPFLKEMELEWRERQKERK